MASPDFLEYDEVLLLAVTLFGVPLREDVCVRSSPGSVSFEHGWVENIVSPYSGNVGVNYIDPQLWFDVMFTGSELRDCFPDHFFSGESWVPTGVRSAGQFTSSAFVDTFNQSDKVFSSQIVEVDLVSPSGGEMSRFWVLTSPSYSGRDDSFQLLLEVLVLVSENYSSCVVGVGGLPDSCFDIVEEFRSSCWEAVSGLDSEEASQRSVSPWSFFRSKLLSRLRSEKRSRAAAAADASTLARLWAER